MSSPRGAEAKEHSLETVYSNILLDIRRIDVNALCKLRSVREIPLKSIEESYKKYGILFTDNCAEFRLRCPNGRHCDGSHPPVLELKDLFLDLSSLHSSVITRASLNDLPVTSQPKRVLNHAALNGASTDGRPILQQLEAGSHRTHAARNHARDKVGFF
jgi:hypothetical protein